MSSHRHVNSSGQGTSVSFPAMKMRKEMKNQNK